MPRASSNEQLNFLAYGKTNTLHAEALYSQIFNNFPQEQIVSLSPFPIFSLSQEFCGVNLNLRDENQQIENILES